MQNKTKFSLNFNQNPSILIIRLSSIGDITLTSHIPRLIREKFPDAQIDYLTFNKFAELIMFNPRINNLFTIDKEDIKNGNYKISNQENKILPYLPSYDIIIDFQNNKYSHKISSHFNLTHNSELFTFQKNRLHKISLVYLKKALLTNFSIPQEYLKTISTLELDNDELGLEVWFEGETDYTPFSRKNDLKKISKICIAPGAAHKTKQWLPERFSQLIKIIKDRYHCDINLLGGKNELELGNQIQQNSGVALNNFIGKLSLLETAKIIDESDLLICNDTGLMHIAAARKVPIVAIFGSSVKELGFIPYKTAFQIVEKELWCRPCSHVGRSFCPIGTFKCMNKIEVSDILKSIGKLIHL
jgi:heptosyltransferase-2